MKKHLLSFHFPHRLSVEFEQAHSWQKKKNRYLNQVLAKLLILNLKEAGATICFYLELQERDNNLLP